MNSLEIESKILEIRRRDPRFSANAYHFIFEALDFTIHRLGRHQKRDLERHIGGRELLEGLREYALEQFGLLAKVVFETWGISRTEDFGEIVFNMVDAGLLNKRQEDSKADFKDGYDFDKAFNFDKAIKNRARNLASRS